LRHTATALLTLGTLGFIALALALAPLWRGFDVARELWPVLVVVSAAGTALLIGNRHRAARWAGLVLFAAILAPGAGETWHALTVRAPASSDASAAPGTISLSIATHNMWGRNASPDAASTLLPPLATDVLALQEAFGRARPAADALEAQYAFSARCRANRILSNLPILDSGCVTTPPEVMAVATIACDWEMPPAVWARLRLPDGSEAVFITAHLTWPFPGATQDCQRRGLARALRQWPHDRLVVMGDFNAAAPARALSRLSNDFNLERRSIGIATFPAEGRFQQAGWGTPPFPTMVLGIDHIFAGDAWETVSIGAGPNTGSDHRPLVAVLRLRAHRQPETR
tara:strand:+ start:65028 stop:66053 length:1026 start_codon:yes stop_codon:yes gene_type:complete